MTEMFGEAWSPMSVPDLAPDDDDDDTTKCNHVDHTEVSTSNNEFLFDYEKSATTFIIMYDKTMPSNHTVNRRSLGSKA